MTISVRCLLLVEDDENDIVLTERRLLKAALPVKELVIARSLAETKQLLAAKDVDVVLLDLNLSDSQATDTVKAVRAATDAVVIVLTSMGTEEMGIQSIREGADDFLIKSELCENALRASIVYSMTRRSLRLTVANIKDKIDKIEQLGSR